MDLTCLNASHWGQSLLSPMNILWINFSQTLFLHLQYYSFTQSASWSPRQRQLESRTGFPEPVTSVSFQADTQHFWKVCGYCWDLPSRRQALTGRIHLFRWVRQLVFILNGGFTILTPMAFCIAKRNLCLLLKKEQLRQVTVIIYSDLTSHLIKPFLGFGG